MEAEVETDVPCTVGEDGEEEEAMAEERESEVGVGGAGLRG